jgi:hypothetical protein
LLGATLFDLPSADKGITYGTAIEAIKPERNCLRFNISILFASIFFTFQIRFRIYLISLFLTNLCLINYRQVYVIPTSKTRATSITCKSVIDYYFFFRSYISIFNICCLHSLWREGGSSEAPLQNQGRR